MATMQDIETAMIAALQDSSAFLGVGRWCGQVDELMTNPKRMPSAWVSYQGATFSPRQMLGLDAAAHVQSWSVFLFLSMLRGLQTSADSGVYAPLAAVRSALTGLDIGGAELWPAGDRLIDSASGIVVYEARFTIALN